mmetsp:Transcript_32873/g.82871  ORF Transcript_32873/g.82871 Transcript_32873/m.82871 type:complete len:118 (-) Transcript_32873:235-588(-)
MVYMSVVCHTSGSPYHAVSPRKFSKIREVHDSALTTLTADAFTAEVVRRSNHSSLTAVVVRLNGLRGAAHLNGREGELVGQDPKDPERFTVCLEGGQEVGVKAINYEAGTAPKIIQR